MLLRKFRTMANVDMGHFYIRLYHVKGVKKQGYGKWLPEVCGMAFECLVNVVICLFTIIQIYILSHFRLIKAALSSHKSSLNIVKWLCGNEVVKSSRKSL